VGLGVAVATAIATGGIFFAWYVPGGDKDFRYMTAGLLDLEGGQCIWVDGAMGPGDPKNPTIVAGEKLVEELLHGLVHREVLVDSYKKE